MKSPESSPEQTPRAAGLAGSLRTLLLALTGVAFLVVGTGLGFFLQNLQNKSATHAEASSHGEDGGHEAHSASAEELPPVDDQEAADGSAERVVATTPATTAHPADEPLVQTQAPAGQGARPAAGHSAELPAEQLANADKLLMVGNYRNAYEAYSALLNQAPHFQEAAVRLRIALCEELLGELQQSQASYRRVVELRPGPDYLEAAILGQARLWCATGRNELAAATLFRAILTGTSQPRGSTHSQIPHELALLVSQRVPSLGLIRSNTGNHYADESLLTPTMKVDPYQVISNLSGPLVSPPKDPAESANEIFVVERFSAAPEETFVNVRCERMTVLELVRRVANRTGLTVRITEEARLRLQEFTVQPDLKNLPLSLVLDSILDPFETIWKTDQDALLIFMTRHAKPEEVRTYRTQAALRSLRFACTYAPEHPWAAASSLELARLSAQSGNLDVAARHLSTMLLQYPRSEFQAVGYFNLAKIELQLGKLDVALNAFYRAADLLSGHPLESLSYLYAGRIQIENERARDAISPLTRALVLAEGTQFEPMAALQLASAYMLLEHYQRANEILMEHRSCLVDTPEQDQAAFLSNLIRYRAGKDQHEKFRAGTALLGCLTNLDPGRCFGGHWPWLAGQAFRDFGMLEQEIAVLKLTLNGSYAYPLQNHARLMLLEDAPEQLTDLRPQVNSSPSYVRPPAVYFQTRLKEATTVFRSGDLERALKMSLELSSHPHISEEERRAALRLMGQIYQSRGEHEFAVRCFSGMVPDVNTKEIPPTAALPFPSQGVQ
ncbi:hypothetical protein SH661x_000561 [Planctomicrobium sp. SH661]|uniref:tetratricopeptide repeat protein n=1 Tax=Planctomicrobium sp. SH661 TaxID=3448124 RepID=UPI003F5C8DC1